MSADRPSGDVGTRLRDARTRRGISLPQIARATKISVAVLEALERNDMSKLPGGIFSRAFVRSYAIEVGLDPDETIQAFISQCPADAAVSGHLQLHTASAEDNEVFASDRRTATTVLRLIAVSIPIAAVILYFNSAGRSLQQRSGATTPLAAPARPLAPAVVPTSVPSATAEPLPPGVQAAAGPATGGAAPAPAATSGDRLLVELTATRPCWVSATADGQKTIERLLQPGEQHAIEVHHDLVLTAGDASAIALTLNGAGARPLGKAGEVVTARLNLTNFKEYLLVR